MFKCTTTLSSFNKFPELVQQNCFSKKKSAAVDRGNVSQVCYWCGEKGHISRDCPNGDRKGRRGGRRGGGGGGQQCYNCFGYGHFARECNVGKAGGGRGRVDYGGGRGGVKVNNGNNVGHISRDCPDAGNGGGRHVKGGLSWVEFAKKAKSTLETNAADVSASAQFMFLAVGRVLEEAIDCTINGHHDRYVLINSITRNFAKEAKEFEIDVRSVYSDVEWLHWFSYKPSRDAVELAFFFGSIDSAERLIDFVLSLPRDRLRLLLSSAVQQLGKKEEPERELPPGEIDRERPISLWLRKYE